MRALAAAPGFHLEYKSVGLQVSPSFSEQLGAARSAAHFRSGGAAGAAANQGAACAVTA